MLTIGTCWSTFSKHYYFVKLSMTLEMWMLCKFYTYQISHSEWLPLYVEIEHTEEFHAVSDASRPWSWPWPWSMTMTNLKTIFFFIFDVRAVLHSPKISIIGAIRTTICYCVLQMVGVCVIAFSGHYYTHWPHMRLILRKHIDLWINSNTYSCLSSRDFLLFESL